MIPRHIATLLITFLLAIPPVMGAAGDPHLHDLVPMDDQVLYPVDPNDSAVEDIWPPDAHDLAGIETAIVRLYGPPDMFTGSQSATPMVEEDLTTPRYSSTSFMVYQFDSTDNAATAYDQLSQRLLGTLASITQGAGDEVITSEDLPGIGTQAMRSSLVITATSDDGWTIETTFEYITVQRDAYIFVVGPMSGRGPVEGALPDDTESSNPMIDLATAMADHGAPASDEVVFAEDGTSTGGLWEFMPVPGDPLLMGLVPFQDSISFPPPAGDASS